MPSSPPALDQLQRWLQAVITSPAGVAAGVVTDEALAELNVPPDDLERVISRSRQLTSQERLSIYQRAYFARLIECLREMFPMTARLLGEAAFDDLAVAYLHESPSRSYTLNRLGDRFAEFLQSIRPQDASAALADVVIDLVRLEAAINEVFDGPGLEDSAAEQLQASTDDRRHPADPAGQTHLHTPLRASQPDKLRLRTAPCLRLMEFRHPINDCYTALRENRQPPLPKPGESYLALSRRSFIVQRHSLTRAEYATLSALQRGEPVAFALEAGFNAIESPIDDLSAEKLVHDWFQKWTEAGFFDLRDRGPG